VCHFLVRWGTQLGGKLEWMPWTWTWT
jgi:hypothetical protein